MAAPDLEVEEVCAVVVTYFPQPDELAEVLNKIGAQVGGLLVIDNGTPPEVLDGVLSRSLPGRAVVVRNSANEGLGSAYNQAARWARSQGFSYLLLMDQDSRVAPNLVKCLVDAHRRLAVEVPLAAVGAAFVDAHTGRPAPFIRIGFPFNRKIFGQGAEPVECDFLISSGTLVELEIFDRVGGLDESLFIDNVDLEWCFRARARGYCLFGVPSARMEHRIGDAVRSLPFGLGQVVVHSPARLYYMMRNRVLLYTRAETPRVWTLQDIPRLVLKLFRLSMFVPPRWRNMRAMLRGITDGACGRSGRGPSIL